MILQRFFIALSIFFALIYSTLPINAVSLLAIDPMVLLLLCWCFISPKNPPSLMLVWAIGLLQDLLSGALLGQHALVLTVVCYTLLKLYRRLRFFAIWQQVLCVGCLVLLNQILIAVIEACQGHFASLSIVVAPAIMTMIAWLLLGSIVFKAQELL